MFAQVDTRSPHEVEGQVRSICRALFPQGDITFVGRAFEWAGGCFAGRFDRYQPIDAPYHDFEHTLQGTLCLGRLLHGRHAAGAKPALTPRSFELALLAILFHDTGYLKKTGDHEGTGAKYTLNHVDRSADFAREFLSAHKHPPGDIEAIRSMIFCTAVNAPLDALPFRDSLERTLGHAVATADLLGQMAAPDYVDKLPALYQEFAEALRHGGANSERLAACRSAEELARNTPSFWQNYVLPKITDGHGRLFEFLNDPYPDGPNAYLLAIEANLERIKREA
jgi:hypothetical protein